MNKQTSKAWLAIVLVWTVLCAIGALASYVDRLQQGVPAGYGLMFVRWWGHMPW